MQQPATQHPAITAYEKATGGVPDCFEYLTADTIRECAKAGAAGRPDTTPKDVADSFISDHFEMLSDWRDALDGLDSELRCHVVAGGLQEGQALYLKQQALGLFCATTALQRAVCEYHHGAAGPALDEAYGHAYALSNSALSPF